MHSTILRAIFASLCDGESLAAQRAWEKGSGFPRRAGAGVCLTFRRGPGMEMRLGVHAVAVGVQKVNRLLNEVEQVQKMMKRMKGGNLARA